MRTMRHTTIPSEKTQLVSYYVANVDTMKEKEEEVMTHDKAIQFLETHGLEQKFRGVMADGKMFTMHSDRWSLVFDWCYYLKNSMDIALPDGIETDLTYYWESLL